MLKSLQWLFFWLGLLSNLCLFYFWLSFFFGFLLSLLLCQNVFLELLEKRLELIILSIFRLSNDVSVLVNSLDSGYYLSLLWHYNLLFFSLWSSLFLDLLLVACLFLGLNIFVLLHHRILINLAIHALLLLLLQSFLVFDVRFGSQICLCHRFSYSKHVSF